MLIRPTGNDRSDFLHSLDPMQTFAVPSAQIAAIHKAVRRL